MARTGRFGRLPTQAPDLSSQIVSLMEQWMNAEDRNILDAWTNGGKYKGKKVTDGDITAHYRKRRNSYDRDDPEWDEWNQDLWQVRYQIADEKVQMQYRMGKIGPQAVAAHYRKWARKMPKNSSYYRNLMATAGDFAKASAAGRSAASKGFDYQAMQDRINKLEARERPIDQFFAGISQYAIARGFIPNGTDIRDPSNLNAFEAHDLQSIFDGFVDHPDHRSALDAARSATGFTGRLTDANVSRLVGEYVSIQKQKIREWRKAPYDMSSYIKGARDQIRDARSYNRLVKQKGGYFDTGADLAEAFDIWSGQTSDRVGDNDPRRTDSSGRREEGIMGAIDPEDALSGDANFVGALKKARDRYANLGETDEVAALNGIIKAFSGDESAVQELNEMDPSVITGIFGPGSPWAAQGGISAFARERMALIQAAPLLASGQAVIVFNEPVSPTEMALGETAKTPFMVFAAERDAQGRTVLRSPVDDTAIIVGAGVHIMPTVGSDGQLNPTLIRGRQVLDAEGEPLGYQFDHEGSTVFGRQKPGQPGSWQFLPYSPWTQGAGATLDDRGETIHVVTTGEEGPTGELPVIQSIDEALQVYADSLANIDPTTGEDLTAEERDDLYVKAREVTEEFAADPEAVFNDPEKLAEYVKMHPEDFAGVSWAEGGEFEADAFRAAARESGRRRYGLQLPYGSDPADAKFVHPGGWFRTGDEVELNTARGFDPTNEAVGQRNDILVSAGYEGAESEVGYDSALRGYEKENFSTATGLGGTPTQGWAMGPDAYGSGDSAWTETPFMPDDILEEDTGVQQQRQGGGIVSNITAEVHWDGIAVGTVGQAFALMDPELQRAAKVHGDDFDSVNLMNFSAEDQARLDLYARERGAGMQLDYHSLLIQKVQSGASLTATEAAELQGFGAGMAERTVAAAQNITDSMGEGWEPNVEQMPEAADIGFFQNFSPVALGEQQRIDSVQAKVPDRVEAPKAQPQFKIAADLLNPAESIKPVQTRVKVAQMPQGIAGPPAPVSIANPRIPAPVVPSAPSVAAPAAPASPKSSIQYPMGMSPNIAPK